MEDIEEITIEVTEMAQAYLDPRRDEPSSIATSDLFRRNMDNNWVKKLKYKIQNLLDIKVSQRQLWTDLIN